MPYKVLTDWVFIYRQNQQINTTSALWHSSKNHKNKKNVSLSSIFDTHLVS